MAAYIEEHRVEPSKSAAACSAKQQPNDVMKGFLVPKRTLCSLKFKYSELQEVEVLPPERTLLTVYSRAG